MSRNVVLVTADSLRADHCGYMGYGRDTTPTLDRMAADGLVFENAVSPGPSTPESMSATHTGEFLKPYYTGEEDSAIVHRRESIRRHLSRNPTIADELSKAGYTTIGFSPNPFTSRHFGFQRGFDHYEDFLAESRTLGIYDRLFERFVSGQTSLTPIRLFLNWVEGEEIFKSWEQYYEDVLAQVRAAEEPFFLWVFLLDTHLPYLVDRHRRDGVSWLDMWRYNLRLYTGDEDPFTEAERRKLVSLYDSTVKLVDSFLDRLTSDLGEYDPAYVFHGDHGEAFGEHGTYGHDPFMYEENIHVPYVVSNVGRSGRYERAVSLRTIPSAIADIADIDDPFGTGLPSEAGESPVLCNPFGKRSAFRTRAEKFIWTGDLPDGNAELYDLEADPGEARDLSEERPEAADGWRRLGRSRVDEETERLRVSNAVEDVLAEAEL
jgi:arylsulfatase